MSRIRVSAVKYTNSIPFIYGLQNYPFDEEIDLSLDNPAECYTKLLNGKADIGLVPVTIKKEINAIRRVSDYGIGANGKVLSVILVSKSPVNEIKRITLDYQSRTSAMLTKLLCRDLWKINPVFIQALPGYETKDLSEGEANLIIGDRTFPCYLRNDIIITDLAGEWTKYTNLPFVFAFWASVQEIPYDFEQKFNHALNLGMSHKVHLAKEMSVLPQYNAVNLPQYLNENIIHEISPAMQEGMNLFLHLIRDF